ncbi:hypothetical protein E2C01_048423 [Portunus trituberculatus]|uniref:Uncharacterized protein n=1 Tax=Portunus trituberculatus TaxID=210409 RepID=A0A5B7GDC3_PORTR|nr:hypothetical protein [Portunus trituberculatus]
MMKLDMTKNEGGQEGSVKPSTHYKGGEGGVTVATLCDRVIVLAFPRSLAPSAPPNILHRHGMLSRVTPGPARRVLGRRQAKVVFCLA